VPAAPDAEGGRQQAFLDVEADRPSRDTCETGQFVDTVSARVLVHAL
jgi:hypothetical protein